MAGRRFAEGTKVAIETTRMELEKVLRAYGADALVMGWEGDRSVIAFRLRGRQVRYTVDRPSATESVVSSYPSGKPRPRHLYAEAIAAEHRRRWRALLLIVKAKLELVATGDSEFEDEFLTHVMLPDGTTVGEWIAPQLDQTYESGQMPALMPGTRPALPPGGRR
jgi:hypothetical protein